jgi:hypothetical protein
LIEFAPPRQLNRWVMRYVQRKNLEEFPEQSEELEADVVRGDDLIVGSTYFMVTYPDSLMSTPIVITYRYLGQNPAGLEEDEPGPHYYFRYLPAFQSESDEDDAKDVSAWSEVFPDGFSGWGETAPTSFSQEKLSGFESLDGLVEELIRVRSRLAERDST